MRRLLAIFTIIGVIAPRRQVGPKQVNFGTRPVGSLTFAEVTVTNTSSMSLLLVDAVELR
jgi:hypothetical protein